MTKEYIKVSDIKRTSEKIPNIKIYQFQPQDNKDTCLIKHVADLADTLDVKLGQFKLGKNNCLISNPLYKEEDLNKTPTYVIQKIIVTNKKQPIGCLMYSFNTFTHINENTPLSQYIDSPVKGFFTITYHFDGKKIQLGNYTKCLNSEELMEVMIGHLMSDQLSEYF